MVESAFQQGTFTKHEISAQSFPIHAVDLYSIGRAEVKRRIYVKLAAGSNEIQITSLPALDKDSVSLSGSSDSQIVIHAVTLGTRPINRPTTSVLLKDLEEQKGQLEDKLSVKRAGGDSLLAYLKTFSVQHIKISDIAHGAADIEAQLSLSMQAVRALEKQLKEVEEQADEERSRLNSQGQDDILRTLLTVSLDVEAAGGAALDLSYAVYGTSWQPSYQLKCQTEKEAVDIIYKATVSQTTTEPWNNVDLTLQTSVPSAAGAEMPTLSPQRIDLYQEPPKSNFPVAAPANVFMNMSTSAPAPAAAPLFRSRRAVRAEATVTDTGSSQSFSVAGRPSVPPDGTEKTVTVAMLLLPASLYRAAVPKLSTACHLKARIINDSQFVMLPGPTSVTLDGAFVASSRFHSSIQPAQRFEANLGADASVKVSCSAVRTNDSKDNRLFGSGTLFKQHSRRIELRNNGRRTVQVVVYDQTPIANNKIIVVTCEQPPLGLPPSTARAENPSYHIASDISAKWAEEDNEDPNEAVNVEGRVRFDVTIGPGAGKTLDLSYKVAWPAEERLTGI